MAGGKKQVANAHTMSPKSLEWAPGPSSSSVVLHSGPQGSRVDVRVLPGLCAAVALTVPQDEPSVVCWEEGGLGGSRGTAGSEDPEGLGPGCAVMWASCPTDRNTAFLPVDI